MVRLPLLLTAVGALIACRADAPVYTKDRLSHEQLDEMVAAPLAAARAGDLPRARREFETLLARSAGTEPSDLLTAFGVGLYVLGQERDDEGLSRAGLPYLRRAIPATVALFGEVHPETALVLNSYADALSQLSPLDPPVEADKAYARAFEIRVRTLGRGNVETQSALFGLAQVKGLPSRTRGEPARIAEAAAMFNEVIRGREANPDQPDYEPAENARFALIEMYVANGRLEQATAAALRSEAVTRPRNVKCDIGPARVAVAAALTVLGREAEAKETLDSKSPPPPECLFDATFLRAGKSRGETR